MIIIVSGVIVYLWTNDYFFNEKKDSNFNNNNLPAPDSPTSTMSSTETVKQSELNFFRKRSSSTSSISTVNLNNAEYGNYPTSFSGGINHLDDLEEGIYRSSLLKGTCLFSRFWFWFVTNIFLVNLINILKNLMIIIN